MDSLRKILGWPRYTTMLLAHTLPIQGSLFARYFPNSTMTGSTGALLVSFCATYVSTPF